MFASTFIIAKAVTNMQYKINSTLLKASGGTNYHNQKPNNLNIPTPKWKKVIMHIQNF
jgi:hypothetical protein